MTIQNRIAKVEASIDRLLTGRYCDVDIGWVCDSISWLYKYRHNNEELMNMFVDGAIAVMEFR